MQILLPPNIYSAILMFALPKQHRNMINIKPASTIAPDIASDTNKIGLIPSCELLSFKHLFISSKCALSFDGNLSTAYLYFAPNQSGLEKLFLRGDITSNEIILPKILFKEKYNVDLDLILDTHDYEFMEKNYLIAGQENNDFIIKQNAISFADQIAEFLDYPYVNFVVASGNKDLVLEFEKSAVNLDRKIEDEIQGYLEEMNLSKEFFDYMKSNFNSVYFELTDNEKFGLEELLKLPYYHGIIEDITNLQFA